MARDGAPVRHAGLTVDGSTTLPRAWRPAFVGLAGALGAALALGPRPASVVLAVLTATLVMAGVLGRVPRRWPPLGVAVWGVVFGWQSLTAGLAAGTRGIASVWRGAWYRLPYVVLSFVPLDGVALRLVLHLTSAAGGLIVVASGVQATGWVTLLSGRLVDPASGRLEGMAGHPNSFAGYLAALLIVDLVVGIVVDRRLLWHLPLLVTGFMLAGSRGWLLGLVAALVVFVVVAPSVRRAAGLLLGLGVVVVSASLLIPGFGDRLGSSTSVDANEARLTFWELSWETFTEHPAFGVGSGELPGVLEPARAAGRVDNAAQGHSLYLHALAEDGALGLVLVVGGYGYFLVAFLLRARARAGSLGGALSAAVAMVFVALLVEGIFDHNFSNATVAMAVTFVLGLAEGQHRRSPPAEEHYDPARSVGGESGSERKAGTSDQRS